ncbi:ATP-binding protein [bacterium]|nr:ATP-binding protein [bacterium]
MNFLPDKTKLIEILSSWNLWNNNAIDLGKIRNEYLDKISSFIKTGKVVTITGVRRSGKSTIMRQFLKKLINEGVESKNTLYINFEEAAFGNLSLELLLKMYEAYNEIIQPDTKPYIFLDEIQNIPAWEKFVRSLNEKKEAHIIISGSNSKMLSKEFATVLTGRQIMVYIFPLSFREFLLFKDLKNIDNRVIALKGNKIRRLFREYLQYGGFPEVVNINEDNIKIRLLDSYMSDIIQKDIINRYNVRKIKEFQALINFYLANYSGQISFNSIRKFISLDTKTISEYTYFFEETNLIFFVKKYSNSLKEQEVTSKKIYFIDVGFENLNKVSTSENFGKKLENLVSIKLKYMQLNDPLKSVYFWKDMYNKKEVDFLLKRKNRISELIQVSWNIDNNKTKEREISALVKGLKQYDFKKGVIITEDIEYKEKHQGYVIEYIPIWKWLLI